MGPKLNDKARQYCSEIAGNRNHVRCNFCGHAMWGGAGRMKEHLAGKRGDVAACDSCPPELATEMQALLIELSLEKEKKHKRKRQILENMRRRALRAGDADVDANANANADADADANANADDDDDTDDGADAEVNANAEAEAEAEAEEEERDLVEKAMKASLETSEVEKKRARFEEEEFEAACRESARLFELQQKRRGEGSSRAGGAGTSDCCDWSIDDFDYDSDFDF